MISKVLVYGRLGLNHHLPAIESGLFAREHKCEEAAIVSIRNPEKPAIMPAQPNVLNLAFHDIIAPSDKMVLASDEHLRQIIDFITELHARPEKILLIAQCESGSSRSGAVATLTTVIAGYPRTKLKEDNPRIFPNWHMKKRFQELLAQAA